MNVLDDFIMQAIAGLASYKCNLVPKDIYRLRMQDYQNAVAVLKSCHFFLKKVLDSFPNRISPSCLWGNALLSQMGLARFLLLFAEHWAETGKPKR